MLFLPFSVFFFFLLSEIRDDGKYEIIRLKASKSCNTGGVNIKEKQKIKIFGEYWTENEILSESFIE